MNRDIFEIWVGRCLMPELPWRAVFVMENLSAHKRPRMTEPSEQAGGEVLCLLPYSPDLDPIEPAFAKLKHFLPMARRRPVEGLWNEIGSLRDRFTPKDCTNDLANAGYRSS